MTTAVERVLSTTELLEAILLEVAAAEGEKTLLLSQRVSKNFQATISSSVKIQRLLFFDIDQNAPNKKIWNPVFLAPHGSTSFSLENFGFSIAGKRYKKIMFYPKDRCVFVFKGDFVVPTTGSWRNMRAHLGKGGVDGVVVNYPLDGPRSMTRVRESKHQFEEGVTVGRLLDFLATVEPF